MTSRVRTNLVLAAASAATALFASQALAAPYASNIVVSGTTVNFILNENADTLTYSINGGAAVPLTPTKGAQSFVLGSASDTFAISTSKTNFLGYNLATGATTAISANGLSQPTANGGFNLISSDANNFNKFNSPRGVSVSNNPNAPNFGTTYVDNSVAGTVGGRALTGKGVYAVRADQTDAFAQANAAAQNALFSTTTSANTPFRNFVSASGEVYVTGFGDALSGVWALPANMSANTQILTGTTGPSVLPAGSTHGSVTAVIAEGSLATGDLVLYTLDEDLTTAIVTGSGSTTDKNSLWRYNIGSGATPFTGLPTKVGSTVLLTAATSDLDRGADGKFYLAQNRSAGGEAGVFVLSSDGTTVLYDSLTASRALLGNPSAVDILRNLQGMAVSPDQKWMAIMLNNSDVAVVPLVNGIPDLANRTIVDTGTDVNSGRDIAFDSAGNIHYVSSGQGLYRVLSPGGVMTSTLSFDGTSFTFASALAVPEAGAIAFGGLACSLSGVVAVVRQRRTKKAKA